jgi:O-antigen ligase
MSPSNLILLLHAVLGGWLGFYSPVGGLVALVALVATTSGLYWHAGIGNLPTVEAYLLFLMLGALARRGAPRRKVAGQPQPPELAYAIRRWAAVLLLTFAVSTAVALARDATAGDPEEATAPSLFLAHLLMYSAPGLAGQLRWVFVAAVGPALLLLGIRNLPGEVHRRSLLRGLLAGLGLAITVPAIQAIWFNPWARPDLGQEAGVGVSGLFHDPHSYAAYLVLGIGVAAGVSRGSFRRGARSEGWGLLALAFGAFVALLSTNSRAGLIGAMIALIVMIALMPSNRRTYKLRPPGTRKRFAIAAATLLVASTLVMAWPTGRGIARDGWTRISGARMWEPLRPDVEIWHMTSVRVRQALWGKALTIIAQRPIWGAGPDGFRRESVPLTDTVGELSERSHTENAHNYFLQVGAEYGVPALAAFLVLVGMVVAIPGRAARRCADPLQRGLLAGICGGLAGFLSISLTAHPMLLAETQAVFWSAAALGVATAMSSPGREDRGDR